MLKKLFITLLVLILLCAVGAGGVLYWAVVLEPGDEISQENIRSILGRESPVYYSDGETPLGVFFNEAHRQYVDYQDIPESFINAIVAAEDNRFFSHFGFDISGIARAMIKNIEAGKVVQGGSTLTQQTAKNLFKRKDRSYKAKFKELIYALRLEYRYSKEQILEFYSNQFYVSGNGHGLGVAARYYFDKEPKDLTLIESAYIAGSVKRPNYYNPFIQKDQQGVEEALERGRLRADYVLKSMRDLGMISDLEYEHGKSLDIPFKKGSVGYSLDYVMELVTEAVTSKKLLDTLSVHGIDNISTSGIRIITSVDKDIQQETMHALRKQLSYLDVRLRGYQREEVQAELEQLDYGGDTVIAEGNFVFGNVSSISGEGDGLVIKVSVGLENGDGIIDKEGISHLVDARVKWQKNRWSEVEKGDFAAFLEQVQVGDRVWLSVREFDEALAPVYNLERFPLIQGGAMVLQNGRIISVVGGVENRFFNRAMYGKRTMGSSYKPFVYAAALQLGWNAVDMLANRREVFVFQNQAYFPRPDHEIDNDTVSMSWAGVRSENLASVWLTAHLCDHLSNSQFEDVAAYLGLTPKLVDGEAEPYRSYRARIRDRYGIVITDDVLRQAAFRKTVATIQPDLIFEGLAGEYDAMRSLNYGYGFNTFRNEVSAELKTGNLAEWERNELYLRRSLLANTYLDLSARFHQLQLYLGRSGLFESAAGYQSEGGAGEGWGLFYDPLTGHYIYDRAAKVPEYARYVSSDQFRARLDGLDPFAQREVAESIRIGNQLTVKAISFLEHQVQQEYQRMSKALPYSMEVLQEVEDFRILVGLKYLVEFGKFLGIESTLEPILSFPLGSNVVTLLETTRVYEALITGKLNLFTEDDDTINNTLAIIDRIESEDGTLLYRPEPLVRRSMSAKTSMVLGHILENTVKFGTGRYADEHVKIAGSGGEGGLIDDLSISVPLYGKTGTANRYTNASFFGYLPTVSEEGNAMVAENGYGIGVYVGYDDNEPMRKKTTRVTGALGALPAWTDIANALVRHPGFGETLDPVDLSFSGLSIFREDLGQRNLAVLKDYGGRLVIPLKDVDRYNRYQPSIITFGAENDRGGFSPARSFAPFWLNQSPQPANDPAAARPPEPTQKPADQDD
jgi:membrane peptidoglycan carboxypeptidase